MEVDVKPQRGAGPLDGELKCYRPRWLFTKDCKGAELFGDRWPNAVDHTLTCGKDFHKDAAVHRLGVESLVCLRVRLLSLTSSRKERSVIYP